MADKICRMSVDIITEYGYDIALYGLSLSHSLADNYQDFNNQRATGLFDRLDGVAERIYDNDGGHNKFLESIVVWMDIDSSIKWWNQMDTFRIGITKNSESTMHTILRRQLTQQDFIRDISQVTLDDLNIHIADKDFDYVIDNLPISFLQRRQVCVNYKTLRNIYNQRKNHKLHEWHIFTDSLKRYLEHPVFVVSK
jgi:hypothetical protein